MRISKMFWLGLIISVASIGFVLGLLYLQDISFTKSNYTFTVILDNVQGLNVGDNVSMLGKRIGRVSKTKIIGKQIAVELSIDKAFALIIPIDSQLEIKSEGLIGEKYVSISPGKDTKHAILPGDTVQGTREVDFSEITPGIIPLTQDLGTFARRLKATLGEEEKDKVIATIHHLEELTGKMTLLVNDFRETLTDSERVAIRQSISNIKTISDSLKTGLVADINKISKILDDIATVTSKSDELAKTIESLKMTADSFSESAASFSSVIGKFNSAADKLDSTKGTLPKLLNDDAVYNNIDSLVFDLRWIVNDFKENPGRYLKAYFKAKK